MSRLIEIQKLSFVYPGLSDVVHQLATSSENLVASTEFLVTLVTSESQFQALLILSQNNVTPPTIFPTLQGLIK